MSTHVHVACCEVLLLRCSKEEYEPLHDMLGCSSRHSRSAASCLGAEHPGKMGGFAPALRLQPRLLLSCHQPRPQAAARGPARGKMTTAGGGGE